jgi:Glycosyl hydrolases family 16
MGGFYESFDNGVGMLNNTWGDVDTSVRGQITLRGNAGAMQHTGGNDAGNGYGRYEVTAKMSADSQGPAALLWPGNDKWPGPEYDIVEVINGHPYGTVHWNNGGRDAYQTTHWNNIDETQKHTYALDWQPGRIDYYVDGKYMGGFSDHIGKDAAHGGVNEVLSVMNRDFEDHNAFITVYDVKYTPADNVW